MHDTAIISGDMGFRQRVTGAWSRSPFERHVESVSQSTLEPIAVTPARAA
jgi:hypothetical protein